MVRQVNPFIYGQRAPLSHFVGRREEIDACFNAFAAPVCGSVAISGEPRMGKTSLLHAVADYGMRENWARSGAHAIFLYIDCQSISRFSPTRFWQRVLKLLSRLTLDTQSTSELDAAVQTLLKRDDVDATHFESILHTLREHNFVLVLLLDEFEWVVKHDVKNLPITRNFLSSLRALINHSPDTLSLVVASQQPLNIVCRGITTSEGSPFFNNFVFRRLHPLEATEVDDLIERRLVGTGISFTREDRQYIKQVAGTHPFLVQLACALIFNARINDHTHVEYDQIGRRFEEEARHHFHQTWETSTQEERTLLLLITWRWWTRRLGMTAQPDAQTYWELLRRQERELISLAERGLISGDDDQPEPISSVFAWWIINIVRTQSDTLPNADASGDEKAADSISQVIQQVRDVGSQVMRSMSLTPLSDSQREQWSLLPTGLDVGMGLTHPERIGRYELVEVVGRGGMGVVYKAFDPAMSRHVAIKVVQSDTLDNPADMLRLQQEAQLAGQLSHPNIVTLFDVNYQQDAAFIIMEFIEGRTLSQLLRGDALIGADLAINFIGQVADGLDEAHRHGIIHRDLKPSNIMIRDDNRVKITDFGLAKLIQGATLTRPGHLIGTPSYMSPEQARGEEVSPQSDQFSLAIVTYRMIIGVLPFHGEAFQNVMLQIAAGHPRPITEDDIPESAALSAILSRGLARHAPDRYMSCHDFVSALRRWFQLALENQQTPSV